MDFNRYPLLYTLLTISLLVWELPLIGFLSGFIAAEDLSNAGVTLLAVPVARLTYLVVLGILAAKKGRRVIVWVGLTFLTGPFGEIVSYFLMLNSSPVGGNAAQPK